MRPKFHQWLFISGIILAVMPIGLSVIDWSAVPAFEPIFLLWSNVLKTVTPAWWQPEDHLLFMLGWYFSGMVIYSLFAGGMITTGIAFAGRMKMERAN